ncbi:class I SAM-dependent methyltransferase [Pseudoxanthomonas beigongshangi]
MTGAGDSARRFSNRVADYVRYRPGYPDALFDWLHDEQGVPHDALVADIGAGTGIATLAWLRRGHPVIAVEPNAAMREALVAGLAGEPGLRTLDGSAEATGLEAASVDLVASAQAFHWFDPDATRREWARILRPGGLACVFWNSRVATASPFLRDYEALLHAYGEDYGRVAERHPDDAAMRTWFGAGFRAMARFAHARPLDFEALRGRLRSSSSTPPPGDPRHAPMLAELRRVFDKHAEQGMIRFDYLTRVFVGTLH